MISTDHGFADRSPEAPAPVDAAKARRYAVGDLTNVVNALALYAGDPKVDAAVALIVQAQIALSI